MYETFFDGKIFCKNANYYHNFFVKINDVSSLRDCQILIVVVFAFWNKNLKKVIFYLKTDSSQNKNLQANVEMFCENFNFCEWNIWIKNEILWANELLQIQKILGKSQKFLPLKFFL